MCEINTGVDICKVGKFKQYSITQFPRFYTRTFTNQEIEYCMQYSSPETHFAGIFAAKEAIFKAVNQFGIISLSEIEIIHNNNGAPKIIFHSNHSQFINEIHFSSALLTVSVSIAHSNTHAIAFAIAMNKSSLFPIQDALANIRELKSIYDN